MKRILVFSFLLSACGGGSSPDIVIETEETEYFQERAIAVSIQNNGSDPISVMVCSGDIFYVRDKLVNGNWQYWTEHDCFGAALEPFVIATDESMEDTIIVSKPGTYRFRFPVIRGTAEEDTITSNVFSIY